MKISYSLRAFAIYFIILGTLVWFTLNNAIERLNDGMRQSAESVTVDLANILAALIEDQITQQKPQSNTLAINDLPMQQLDRVFVNAKQRTFNAKIYQITKRLVDAEIYVTNEQGFVVFDSNNQHLGADFSQWRDVRLTLAGEYGARTSFIDPNKTAEDDDKIMVIASPIQFKGNIIGVVSVSKPVNSIEAHVVAESSQLKQYAIILLLLALIVGYLLSLWFTYALNKIANYAKTMANGDLIEQPTFWDSRLAELSQAISYMRSQLDGKEYVENYIHSLTHELKTPITSIQGAIELLSEDMPAETRAQFIQNISTSNHRMSRLVDRMLSLAKLEGLTELVDTSHFDIVPTIQRLIQERKPTIDKRGLTITRPQQTHLECFGDKVLISQAIANLLDNAIDFCNEHGQIDISLEHKNSHYYVYLFNQGNAIPDFALNKLYDRFFSLPRPTHNASPSKSTGLGLSFVKEIMKLHHGHVQINNIDAGVVAHLSWAKD